MVKKIQYESRPPKIIIQLQIGQGIALFSENILSLLLSYKSHDNVLFLAWLWLHV